MKKLILLLMLVTTLVACEGPMGPAGPQGEPGYGPKWYVNTFTINGDHWETRNDGGYIYIFDIKELDKFVYEDGKVNIYLIQDPGTEYEVQTPLPYTMHHKESNGDEWTETYSFDYNIGSIAFYVTYSDFPQNIRPSDAKFRVVMN